MGMGLVYGMETNKLPSNISKTKQIMVNEAIKNHFSNKEDR